MRKHTLFRRSTVGDKLRIETVKLKLLFGAITCGVLISLGTGLVNNESGISIPEIKHYGYPLVWLITNLNAPTEYVLTNFALDTVFWVTVSLIILILLEKTAFPKLEISSVSYKSLILPLALLIPLGLVMDFVHESGHAIWGTVMGGKLSYMQVAYFVIFPRLAITPHFRLGLVNIDGLAYDSFGYGLMLLGGSMTTNIASWLIAPILLKTSLGNKTKVALKVLGLFGILDLPFYVIFPQIGLGHWIFLGGCEPEPLLGARIMGIPDPVFYLIVALSTLGLALLYSETLRKKIGTIANSLSRKDIPVQ